MNESDLLDLIKERGLDDLSPYLDKATPNQIIFYKLHPSKNAHENFLRRIKHSSPGLVVINRKPANLASDLALVVMEEEKFLSTQKTILDHLFPKKEEIKLIGITGTNGKTTSVNLSMQIATKMGHKSLAVGTIGLTTVGGRLNYDIRNTSPSYIELRKIIHKHQDEFEAIFFEVSSHALEQNRFYDLRLDLAAWTNFTQDHLDYHQTMEKYFQSKLSIVNLIKNSSQIIVPHQEKDLINQLDNNVCIAKTLKNRGITDLPLFCQADYNKSNLEIALQINELLWNQPPAINLDLLTPPKGRFSTIEDRSNIIIIDYAHTPDALKNVGQAIQKSFPGKRIHTIFGCGGDRDKAKRPIMTAIAASFSDYLYITSDNPRTEDPQEIINDMTQNLDKNYFSSTNRQQSINTAMKSLQENDILLIAGKGHEEYQEIKGKKIPFSDFEVVHQFIKERDISV